MNGILDTMIRAKDFLTEHVDIGALATVGFGGAFIFLMKKMSDAIGFIAEPFKNVSGLIGNISGVFSSISGLIKSFQKTVKAEMFKKYTEGIRNIAISIAILAGSMIALANVDTNKLVSGGIRENFFPKHEETPETLGIPGFSMVAGAGFEPATFGL